LIESLDSAIQRKATIYGEIIGGHINSGGQRNGGTMTAPNNEAVRQCITRAMDHAGIKPEDIDTINGHLTATKNDHMEIKNWLNALGLEAQDFPPINSLKSMIGHCLAAAGSIECVACVLQLHNDFIFPNINCEDVSEEIKNLIPIEKIPQKLINKKLTIIAKSSFGFGDVNGCVIFKKYKQ
jgi:3-oxoacyl-(acyl-carrier-protein) synthase